MKSTVRSISSGRPSSSKPVFHSSPSRLPDLYNVAHTHPDLVHPDLLYCVQNEEIEAFDGTDGGAEFEQLIAAVASRVPRPGASLGELVNFRDLLAQAARAIS